MPDRPIAARILMVLTALAIVLPIGVALLLGLASLLTKMGDPSGGGVVGWIALALGLLWVMDLVCLILVQAFSSLLRLEDRFEEE